jgi:hypothetical protein
MAEFADKSFIATVDGVGDFGMEDILPKSFKL